MRLSSPSSAFVSGSDAGPVPRNVSLCGSTPEPSLSRHFMPEKSYLDQNCPDGVRLEIMFPSCWNGKLDGGSEHKTHVAFPDGVMVGNCPKGYDRRLVSLFFETIVATDQFKGKNGKFVFANGDTTGMHLLSHSLAIRADGY